jgi:ABC-type sugar transport system ATPase subunit
MTIKLELQDLSKRFGADLVVRGLDLTIAEGEFVALLGPSGCGKSTTLSMIAGFERPDSGSILIDGAIVTSVPPQRRNVGLVLQDFAVFARMTVRRNLEFGLRARRMARPERDRRVAELAERLSLAELLERPGDRLNVSEMQRVALARALVTEPALLLLDEPMSNLDASLRARLRTELKLLQRRSGQTVLYVTHDQIEAMSMADRIAVMRDGAIEQVGAPIDVYRRPRTRHVAEFIGEPPINLLACRLERRDGRVFASTWLHHRLDVGEQPPFAGEILLGVRPHDVDVARHPGASTVATTVVDVENLGAEHALHLAYGGDVVTAMAPPGFAAVGDDVHVDFNLRRAHLVDVASGTVFSALGREPI